MKRFDAKSKKLVIFSTLLCIGILALPVLRRFRRVYDPNVDIMWEASGGGEYESSIKIDIKSDSFSIYDKRKFSKYRLSDGFQKSIHQIPARIDWVLEPDGLVSDSHRTIATLGPRTGWDEPCRQILIWDADTGKVKRKIRIDDPQNENRVFTKILAIRDSQVLVAELWRKSDKRIKDEYHYAIYDFNGDTRTSWPRQKLLSPACAQLEGQGSDYYLGWLQARDVASKQAIVNFVSDEGKSHSFKVQVKGAFLKYDLSTPICQLRLSSSGERVWGWDDSSNFKCWAWKTGTLIWKADLPKFSSKKLAISADEKRIALAGFVDLGVKQHSMRIVVLNAETGQLERIIERYSGNPGIFNHVTEAFSKTPDTFLSILGGNKFPGLAWTPNGNSLIVSYDDGKILRWRVD